MSHDLIWRVFLVDPKAHPIGNKEVAVVEADTQTHATEKANARKFRGDPFYVVPSELQLRASQ